MFWLTYHHVGFLSAKVLYCDGLIDGRAYIQRPVVQKQINLTLG